MLIQKAFLFLVEYLWLRISVTLWLGCEPPEAGRLQSLAVALLTDGMNALLHAVEEH